MERIVPRDKILHDYLDPAQKLRRARQRIEARDREYRLYAGEKQTKHIRRKQGK